MLNETMKKIGLGLGITAGATLVSGVMTKVIVNKSNKDKDLKIKELKEELEALKELISEEGIEKINSEIEEQVKTITDSKEKFMESINKLGDLSEDVDKKIIEFEEKGSKISQKIIAELSQEAEEADRTIEARATKLKEIEKTMIANIKEAFTTNKEALMKELKDECFKNLNGEIDDLEDTESRPKAKSKKSVKKQ